MKHSSHTTCPNITALAIAITLVFITPTFIGADSENQVESDNQDVPPVQPQVRVITNADLRESQSSRVEAAEVPSKVEVLELPKRKEADNRPLELTGNQQSKVPAQDNDNQVQPENRIVPLTNYPVVMVARGASPKSVAATRLIEKGRRLLRVGERDKALAIFEKSLGLEANPYVYFYLSEAHYQLGHYQQALNFLEVAESWLDQQPDWAAQLTALRSEIPGSGFARRQIMITG